MTPTPHLRAAIALAAASWLATPGAAAQPASTPASTPASVATPAPLSEGEVRKVDQTQGKLTLRHGPLDNLGMPAMTMVFKVADPQLLEGLKPGDAVRFTAQKRDGAYVVTVLERRR